MCYVGEWRSVFIQKKHSVFYKEHEMRFARLIKHKRPVGLCLNLQHNNLALMLQPWSCTHGTCTKPINGIYIFSPFTPYPQNPQGWPCENQGQRTEDIIAAFLLKNPVKPTEKLFERNPIQVTIYIFSVCLFLKYKTMIDKLKSESRSQLGLHLYKASSTMKVINVQCLISVVVNCYQS